MKKIIIYLSIFMFALTGIMFACNKDKYADLSISISSVTVNGEKVNYDNNGKFYTVLYGEEFTINAQTKCSGDISKSLIFTSLNNDSIHLLKTSDTENGSKATFTAVAPSESKLGDDELFKIKISSVETNRNSKYVFVKVILPVDQIDLTDNLGLTYGMTLNLNDSNVLKYTSIYPNAPYETNEKGATFSLAKYTIDESSFNLLSQNAQSGRKGKDYYLQGNPDKMLFNLTDDGILTILDKTLTSGKLTVNAKSIKYNNNLPANATAEEIAENDKLKSETDITIVKPISYQDISFVGGQVAFNLDKNNNNLKNNKLNASLYLNSLDTYTIGTGDKKETHYYNYENIKFSVYTQAQIKISAMVGDLLLPNGTKLASDKNVLKVPEKLILNEINEQNKRVGYQTNIKISANGGSGNAYVDFVIEYEGFANKLVYNFSDLYEKYLKSQDVDTDNTSEDYAKRNKLTFEASAVASDIALAQDDVTLSMDSMVKVYDEYSNNFNNGYGTKISAELILASGNISANIKNENRIVRVYIYTGDDTDEKINEHFNFYDSNYNTIKLKQAEIDLNGTSRTVFCFDLDLSKYSGYFYVKANSNNLANNAEFTFAFENLIKSTITTYTNVEISSGTSEESVSTTLKNKKISLDNKIVTLRGIKDIQVVTMVEEISQQTGNSENTFYSLDNAKTGSKKLILPLNTNTLENLSSAQGTLIAYFTNLGTLDELQINIAEGGQDLLKIYDLENVQSIFNSFVEGKEIKFDHALSIVGRKLGTTKITFIASNGISVEIDVEVVAPYTENSLELDINADSESVTIKNLKNTDKPYASVISGKSFTVLYNVLPSKSGIYEISYSSSDENVATINAKTGIVNTKTRDNNKGVTEIAVTVKYYKFAQNESGFYQCVEASETKKFNLEVFIPGAATFLRNKVEVYDYNSLGYEFKDLAKVSLPLNITKDSNLANYKTNESEYLKVTFSLSNDNNNLIGEDGEYKAQLNNGQTSAIVYVVLNIEQYGLKSSDVCAVVIKKAVQIEEINVSAFTGEEEIEISRSGEYIENFNEEFYFSTVNSEKITINTSIIPTAENVLVDDLFVSLCREVNGGYIETTDFATITYKDVKDVSNVIINGFDKFTLNISSTQVGSFYLMIFARDGMTEELKGNLYRKIKIEITDGTQEHPYEIRNIKQLMNIEQAPTKHYVLGADINLASISNWKPIKNFTGSLNGYNYNKENTFYTISGLNINTINSDNVGLFEKISNSTENFGAVLNLTLNVSSIIITKDSLKTSATEINLGTIAGTNDGIILNSAVNISNFKVNLENYSNILTLNVGGVSGKNNGAVITFGQGPSASASKDYNLKLKNENDSNNNIKNNNKFSFIGYSNGSELNSREYFNSLNPINGTLEISDSASVAVNAGGIAGYSNGVINGIYGYYKQLNEVAVNSNLQGTNIQYVTSYQNQGIDVVFNINNFGTGKIANANSSLGGVVGKADKNSSIANVSVQGNIGYYDFASDNVIGANNNVGGVVGYISGADGEKAIITDVLSNVKLRANTNVGGIAGYASFANISFAKVEAYEDINQIIDQTLIVAKNYIGGIVGNATNVNVEYSYLNSFVNKYNDSYIVFGDIYSLTGENTGGLVGSLTKGSISSSYVMANIAKKEGASFNSIAGLVATSSDLVLTDVSFVGVLPNEEAIGSDISTINGYSYYYVLEYIEVVVGKDIEENDITEIYLISKKINAGISDSEFNKLKASEQSTTYSSEKVLTVDYYVLENENYKLHSVQIRVPTYVKNVNSEDITYYLAKFVPNSINVKSNNEITPTEADQKLFEIEFNNNANKNLFYGFKTTNGEYQVIINYALLNTSFKLSDLFTTIPSPIVSGALNIVVYSSDSKHLIITSDGNIVLDNKDGKLFDKGANYTLTFAVRENISASQTINIKIVKNFDELLVSHFPTFKESLFTTDKTNNLDEESLEKNAYKIRVKTNLNIFNQFVEYSDKYNQDNFFGIKNGYYLTGITNVDNYVLDYSVFYKTNNGYEAISSTKEINGGFAYSLNNDIISFNATGFYKVVISVTYVVNGNTFKITNENWVIYFNVYAGATEINFTKKEVKLQGQEIDDSLKITLTSDVGDFENLVLQLVDENENIYYLNYNAETGVVRKSASEFENESVEPYPFEITIGNYSHQENSYIYNMYIKVGDYFKAVNTPVSYTLYAYDENEFLNKENLKAKVSLVIVPQSVKGVSGIHYPYSQKVSLIENIGNTEAGGDVSKKNYSHSFSSQPKNTIIAGNEGLFVVDVYPFYANITEISITSSVKDGNALQFVQLVKIQGKNGGDYYIYAPLTQSTPDGGIYLNLYSTVSNAKLKYDSEEKANIEFINAGEDKLQYKFDTISDISETGRLYIKTLAPNNIKEEEQFFVYVTFKYKVVNEQGILVETEYVYEHELVVESMPGFSMNISHNGEEREVIAYTGSKELGKGKDWVEITPIIEDGYSYKNINVSLLIQGKKDKSTSNTDYVHFDVGQNRIYLGEKAKPGDKVLIQALVEIDYDGYTESRIYEKEITVVDLVIESISVQGIDSDGYLKMTVSASKQLKVKINGFGTDAAIEEAETIISRKVTAGNRDMTYYWQVKTPSTGDNYTNLESVNVYRDLPFIVNKIVLNNDVTEEKITAEHIGASQLVDYKKLENDGYNKSRSRIIVLEGSTSAGSVDIRLAVSYVYSPAGTGENAGKIIFVHNNYQAFYIKETYIKVIVTEDSNEDHPTPIYDENGLIEMSKTTAGNYILMNDITIRNHTALNANFNSFDGNNKIITIESFDYRTDLASSNADYSINLGLFNTVNKKTTIKNVIVAYPADKAVAMNLKSYSKINFGGIAAVNEGIITNCDVITVSPKNSQQNTGNEKYYTINIETSTTISGKPVVANIGGLVAINASSGFVTNSRVGRENVEILQVFDSEATVAYKDYYNLAQPMTLFKVYGRANVGGFVSENNGTISTSYAKNIQLEVISDSFTGYVQTGGFVTTNNGFVYGSYVAGWEEENFSSVTTGVSSNRKLGGGILSNGYIGGFVFSNTGYIEDTYSNINVSGDLTFTARTPYVSYLSMLDDVSEWSSPAVGGFVYKTSEGSYITTSYTLSKINTSKLNTHGAFEGRTTSPEVTNDGEVTNCYFMQEKSENFTYEHERARMLSDNPSIDLDSSENVVGTNEFINKDSFNNFSFDNSIDDFSIYTGESMGGVWAVYKRGGTYGYPELISANTIAISCRVINVTKTNNSETNTYYYTYVDGYEAGSYLNPYTVSTFEQYNNIFKDTVGGSNFNEDITTKFTGNIRLIKNIDFGNSEDVYSTSVEFTSLVNMTSIFDGNYLSLYNVKLSDKTSGKSSFGLFKDIYYAAVKNLFISVNSVNAGNTTSVGVLAGVIVNSNISNITLVASSATTGVVIGNNYVGALAGIIVSEHEENLYTISDIQSNLAIVGGTSSDSEIITAIPSSSIIWERIKPTSNSSGLSEINNNLRLHHLPTNVYYGGGIAGLVDLHQLSEAIGDNDIKDANIYNIHVGEIITNNILETSYVNYDRVVSVISDYAGGLFGFLGAETFLDRGEFIAKTDSEEHFISANEIAGGIVGVNFGRINECYLSFNTQDIKLVDENIRKYVDQSSSAEIQINNTLFASGTPNYIGGIAGINVGNGSAVGTGNINHSYNRVNVKNTYAKGVGGIVGASYIGQISNVYTTASLMGDLTNENTKIGAIIGKIFENGDEGYFADYYGSGNESDFISIYNIVAVNMWDSDDFDALFKFVNHDGGYVGALYGKYNLITEENKEEFKEENAFIRVSEGVFVQNYILKDYSSSRISDFDFDEQFDISVLPENSYIELWGTGSEGSENYDLFLSERCGFSNKNANEKLINPNDVRALFSETEYGVSTLRSTYFPSLKWPRSIWNYDDEYLLPILEYGYESSIIRIYTAKQFFDKLGEGNSSGKMYVIMNDIDFGGYESIQPILAKFRGRLIGNDVTYVSGKTEYVRKPILFNLNFNLDNKSNETTYALFKETVGAIFEDFNIVISKYDVKFDKTSSNVPPTASALVAKAQNTTFSNVNIYNSLTELVDKDCLVGNGYVISNKVTNGLSNVDISVTEGIHFNETDQCYSSKSVPFVKLATLDNKASGETFANQYTYVLDGNLFKLVSCKETFEGLNIKEYVLKVEGSVEVYVNVDDPNDKKTILDAQTKIEIVKCSDINIHNANFFGLLMGDSSFGVVKGVSVKVGNVNLKYTNSEGESKLYLGALIGRSTSEIDIVVNVSKINVTSTIDTEYSMYLGGIVGNLQGKISNAYTKNSTIKIGSSSRNFKMASGLEGAFIGGLAGAVDKYTALNEATVGGANFLFVVDSYITTYIQGSSYIGGALGQNSYSANDMYYRNSKANANTNANITINVNDSNTTTVVGGLIALQKASQVNNLFAGANILANVTDYCTLHVGGVIGQSAQQTIIESAICDADNITIKNVNFSFKGSQIALSIGGIIASFDGEDRDVTLNNVMSFVNIIADQHNVMYVGGAVGKTKDLIANNVIVLGNITLNRGTGINADSLFYSGEHRIGGLAGYISRKYTQEDTSFGVVVLSTIRDYAIAQKMNLHIGPVIGTDRTRNVYQPKEGGGRQSVTKTVMTDVNSYKTYYSESISLLANNGYDNVSDIEGNEYSNIKYSFKNINQGDLLNVGTKDKPLDIEDVVNFATMFNFITESYDEVFEFDGENFKSNYYSKYFELPEEDDLTSEGTYVSGSKLSPIEYTGQTLEANKYYILSENLTGKKAITNSISTNATNWVFNAQGNRISISGKAIFNIITEGSAVVGVMTVINTNNFEEAGAIAKENKGFVFSCGSSGSIGNDENVINNAVSGIVHRNYGVINSCFSLVNLYSSASASGISAANGKDANNIGNIYSCYYTGTITSMNSNANYAGVSVNSTYGAISNSYTMADIDLTLNANTKCYPVANTYSKNNIFETYYDHVAYTGGNEGIYLKEQAFASELLSETGFKVWTASFAGDTTALNYREGIGSLINLKGNWLSPGDNTEIKNLYASSAKAKSESSSDIKLETSWFNFGYTTLNLKNILVNIKINKDTIDNIYNYLEMIYTGNGLASKDNEKATKPEKTNNFIDAPYKIKHAGMLDILVRSSNVKGLNDIKQYYKYYIFVRNLDFKKYSDVTYWSENWDRDGTFFVGHIEGNEKIVSNMYSSFGLLRALVNVDAKDKNGKAVTTTVQNIKFNNCYSKTGMIAGFQDNGIIKNIKIDKGYVINGDYSSFIGESLKNVKYQNLTQTGVDTNSNLQNIKITSMVVIVKNDIIPKNVNLGGATASFAGGIVGIMEKGQIVGYENDKSLWSFTDFNVAADGNGVDNTYIGGLVGYLGNSNTENTALISSGKNKTTWEIKNINVYAYTTNGDKADSCVVTNNSYVGGVVGAVANGQVKEIKSSNKITSYYSAGAIAGLVDSSYAEITSCYGSTSNIAIENKEVKNGFASRYITSDRAISIGGIVGVVNEGTISASTNNNAINISAKINPSTSGGEAVKINIALGGIVGTINNGTITDACTNLAGLTIGNTVGTKDNKVITGVKYEGFAGGIAGIMNKGEISSSYNGNDKGNIPSINSKDYSGGISGVIYNGYIYNNENYGTINSDLMAGGIVGYAYADSSQDNIEIESNTNNNSVSGLSAGGIVGEVLSINSGKVSINGTTNNGEISSNASVAGGIVAIASSSIIDNLQIIEATNAGNIKNGKYSGGIVGYSELTEINSCGNSGDVNGSAISGGVVAFLKSGSIKDSSSSGTIKTTNSGGIAGGVIGFMKNGTLQGDISNSSEVTSNNAAIAGGVIGVFKAGTTSVDDDYATLTNSGEVGGKNVAIAGGIIGRNEGSIELKQPKNSGKVYSNAGSVDSITIDDLTINGITGESVTINKAEKGNIAGGIIGFVNSSVTITSSNVINSSEIGKDSEDKTSSVYAGGIIGYSNFDVTIEGNSGKNTNSGDIYSTNSSGGIIGFVASNKVTKLKNVTNNGEITSKKYAGGIFGEFNGDYNTDEITSITVINNASINGQVVGGIVGLMAKDTLSYTKNTGSVGDNNSTYAGGIVGQLGNNSVSATIDNTNQVVMSTNTIKAVKDKGYVGGIVGYLSSGSTYASLTSAKFNGIYVGGLVGYATGGSIYGSVGTSSSKVTIEAGDTTKAIGGIIGYNKGATLNKLFSGEEVSENKYKITIEHNLSAYYATINGKGVIAGGIVGLMDDGVVGDSGISEEWIIEGSDTRYVYGATVNGYGTIGGLVGHLKGGTVTKAKAQKVSSTATTATNSCIAGGLVGKMEDTGYIDNGVGSSVGRLDNNKKYANIAGGLVGEMTNGTIAGGTSGSVEGITDVGGLVGQMTGGTITSGTGGSANGTTNVGGFVGQMTGGSISGGTTSQIESSAENVGGIIGLLSMTNSGGQSITGSITGPAIISGGINVGGLVGQMTSGNLSNGNAGMVNTNYSSSTYTTAKVGGLVGFLNGGTISGNPESKGNCRSSNESTNKFPYYAGGLVGYMSDGIISGGSVSDTEKNNYNKGYVKGYIAGGMVGYMSGKNSKITGGSAGSIGNIDVGDYVGGIVGQMAGGSISSVSPKKIYQPNAKNVGGVVGYYTSGTINNTVSIPNNFSVTGKTNVGGIYGSVENKDFTASVGFTSGTVAGSTAGGLIGKFVGNTLTINALTIDATINATEGAGIVGSVTLNDGDKKITVNGAVSITVDGNAKSGITSKLASGYTFTSNACEVSTNRPLFEQNAGTVTNCTNIKASISMNATNLGAIAMTSSGKITGCKVSGSISGIGTNIGGFVGNMTDGTIDESENSAEVYNKKTSSATAGGFVGLISDGTIGQDAKDDESLKNNIVNTGTIKIGDSLENSLGKSFIESSGKNNSNASSLYVGGIAGYVEGTSAVYGNNESNGNIYGSVRYTTSGIIDNRGKIAGGRDEEATVVNNVKHSTAGSYSYKDIDTGESESLGYTVVAIKRIPVFIGWSYVGSGTDIEPRAWYFYVYYGLSVNLSEFDIEKFKGTNYTGDNSESGVWDNLDISKNLDLLVGAKPLPEYGVLHTRTLQLENGNLLSDSQYSGIGYIIYTEVFQDVFEGMKIVDYTLENDVYSLVEQSDAYISKDPGKDKTNYIKALSKYNSNLSSSFAKTKTDIKGHGDDDESGSTEWEEIYRSGLKFDKETESYLYSIANGDSDSKLKDTFGFADGTLGSPSMDRESVANPYEETFKKYAASKIGIDSMVDAKCLYAMDWSIDNESVHGAHQNDLGINPRYAMAVFERSKPIIETEEEQVFENYFQDCGGTSSSNDSGLTLSELQQIYRCCGRGSQHPCGAGEGTVGGISGDGTFSGTISESLTDAVEKTNEAMSGFDYENEYKGVDSFIQNAFMVASLPYVDYPTGDFPVQYFTKTEALEIVKSGSLVTDCFGYLRFCGCIAELPGLTGHGGYTEFHYYGSRGDASADNGRKFAADIKAGKIPPGTAIAYEETYGSGWGHVAMYLYHDDTYMYYIDISGAMNTRVYATSLAAGLPYETRRGTFHFHGYCIYTRDGCKYIDGHSSNG